jgi:hypothetical protein
MYDTYILSNNSNKLIADEISNQLYISELYECTNLVLTPEALTDMAKNCMTEYFYVIVPNKYIQFTETFRSYKPKEQSKDLVHIWGDKEIRLFRRDSVLHNPAAFDDIALSSGNISLLVSDNIIDIYNSQEFDIIFLSYDESNADKNFHQLKQRFPRAKRVHGIKGILPAHTAAARLAKENNSNMFYVVDADAEIYPTFKFNYEPQICDIESVHIWYSKNPVNGLEYGYGGIKLFPTEPFFGSKKDAIDMSTVISGSVKVIPEVSNVTRFDTDPFTTWRSAFRECVKLSSKLIKNQDNNETEIRLNTWCSIGNGEFGEFSLMGANEGREYGDSHKDQPDLLGLINDFSWLEAKFNS